MGLTLYSLSGSPYGWRVALALEHKGLDHTTKLLSYDAGDFAGPALQALNPRRRVPVIDDEGFVLYESAAIVEYLEDRHPGAPRLFSSDLRERAIQRRLVREADAYFANALEALVEAVLFTPRERWSDERIAEAGAGIRGELAAWESMVAGDFLAGELSAVDFTLFPQIALAQRIGRRKPGLFGDDLAGPRIDAWMQRMAALPIVQKTWPPHWR